MQKHAEKQPELPPDMQRLNIALARLYKRAITLGLEAEAEEMERAEANGKATRTCLAADRVASEDGREGTHEGTTTI